MLPYALAIFVGAFLLFQVQPLIAKYILPWFGGGSAVWTASMLFFQVFLLAGYAYAHLIIQKLKPRVQVFVHGLLVLAALSQLPVAPSDAWKPQPGGMPTLQIVTLLTASIGLPYLVLSATSPLMQAWFSRSKPGASPYRLYALSNAGSLLALLSYPFLVEPNLTRSLQSMVWSAGYGLFVICCGLAAIWTWRAGGRADGAITDAQAESAGELAPAPGALAWTLWAALPMMATLLLLAFTNQITQDIAPVPFLWILPLSLYLLAFIIAFDSPRWYVRPVFTAALVPALGAAVWLLFQGEDASIMLQIGGFSAVLFFLCMFCLGELSRLRPAARYLTGYYLMIALGGALGGLFVALVSPLIFPDFFELHVGLWGVAGLALVIFFTDERGGLYRGRPRWAWAVLLVAVGAMSYGLGSHIAVRQLGVIEQSRNFYGAMRVLKFDGGRVLEHGSIYHGMQFDDPPERELATTYFSGNSGIGLTMSAYPTEESLRVGVLGLGIGTLAAYGLEGDVFRFYEIDPKVRQAAETDFSYLADSRAQIEIVMGDARLSLEREPDQNFDLLIVDAFSSDAVPVHLLTDEAFTLYRRHLKPEGVLAIQITNRHLNLEPVVRGLASRHGMEAVRISATVRQRGIWPSDWMLVSNNHAFFTNPAIAGASTDFVLPYDSVRVWTDDYSSLFPVLR